MLGTIIFVTALTAAIGKIIIDIFTGFKKIKSRSDIAHDGLIKVFLLAGAAISSITTDWKADLIGITSNIFGFRPVETVPNMITNATVFGIFLSATVIILLITHIKLKNYDGPFFLSDDYAGVDIRHGGIQDIIALKRARSQLHLNRQADVPLLNRGDDPKDIKFPTIEPTWIDISLSLYCASNLDLQEKEAKWSDAHQCWFVEEVNFLDNSSSRIIVVMPFDLKASLFSVDKHILFSSWDLAKISEIIVCIDSEEDCSKIIDHHGVIIKIISKNRLIADSLNLIKYAKHIISEFERRERITVRYAGIVRNFSLADTYVEPRVSDHLYGKSGQTGRALMDVIGTWLIEEDRGQLTLLGEFGQGKSSAVLAFAAAWAKQYIEDSERASASRVPLLIELRGRSPMDSNGPEDLLGEWGGRFGLSGASLMNLIKSKRAVLIFEGFDEVKNAARELDRYRHFNALWQFAFSGSKIIFTGRPNFFWGQQETRSIMRSSDDLQHVGLPYSHLWSLDFLTRDDIAAALRNMPQQIVDQIMHLVDNDASFQNIAQRPSMLPAIASQWENIMAAGSADTEITSASILDSYIKSSYLRKEPKDLYDGSYQLVHWKIRHVLTQLVSLHMLKVGGRNTISSQQIEDAVEMTMPLLDDIFEGKSGEADVADSWRAFKALSKQNEEGGASMRDRIRALAQDVRANGIMAPDPAGGFDRFYFPHKQFYEFLLASFYADLARDSYYPLAVISSQSLSVPKLEEAVSLEAMILYHLAMIGPRDDWEKHGKIARSTMSRRIIDNISDKIFMASFNIFLFSMSWKYSVNIDSTPAVIIKKNSLPLVIIGSGRRLNIYNVRLIMMAVMVSFFVAASFISFKESVGSREIIGGFFDFVFIYIIPVIAIPMFILQIFVFSIRRYCPLRFSYFVCCSYRLPKSTVDQLFGRNFEHALLRQALMFSEHRNLLREDGETVLISDDI